MSTNPIVVCGAAHAVLIAIDANTSPATMSMFSPLPAIALVYSGSSDGTDGHVIIAPRFYTENLAANPPIYHPFLTA